MDAGKRPIATPPDENASSTTAPASTPTGGSPPSRNSSTVATTWTRALEGDVSPRSPRTGSPLPRHTSDRRPGRTTSRSSVSTSCPRSLTSPSVPSAPPTFVAHITDSVEAGSAFRHRAFGPRGASPRLGYRPSRRRDRAPTRATGRASTSPKAEMVFLSVEQVERLRQHRRGATPPLSVSRPSPVCAPKYALRVGRVDLVSGRITVAESVTEVQGLGLPSASPRPTSADR